MHLPKLPPGLVAFPRKSPLTSHIFHISICSFIESSIKILSMSAEEPQRTRSLSSTCTVFSSLPKEIFEAILHHMQAPDHVCLALTCHWLYNFILEMASWERLSQLCDYFWWEEGRAVWADEILMPRLWSFRRPFPLCSYCCRIYIRHSFRRTIMPPCCRVCRLGLRTRKIYLD
jgi:hypothetical protein